MSLENTNLDKLRRLVALVKNELSTVVMIAMAFIIWYQAKWIKDLTMQQHLEDKEYMEFFRDSYNEATKYINYSRRNEENTINYPIDTVASKRR